MKAGDFAVFFVTAIIGLATLAVILSSQAQTSNVISAFASALSNLIASAVAPITGAQSSQSN